jgi:hypothetical protein
VKTWEFYNRLGNVKGDHEVVLDNSICGQYEHLTVVGVREVEIDGRIIEALVVTVP